MNLPRFPIFGVLNITPDSFSDGGQHMTTEAALNRATALRREGAHVVDIGADSTRPGSLCVGPQEEWRRLAEVLAPTAREGLVSVDTHHAEVARAAIHQGASFINDISGAVDTRMWDLLEEFPVYLIAMFSRCRIPHDFNAELDEGSSTPTSLIDHINRFIETTLEKATKRRIALSRVIIDPGMGGFLSAKAEKSWHLLSHWESILSFKQPLLVGLSRKGFLAHLDPSLENIEKDWLSAHLGSLLALSALENPPVLPFTLGFRVHHPRAQRLALAAMHEMGHGGQ